MRKRFWSSASIFRLRNLHIDILRNKFPCFAQFYLVFRYYTYIYIYCHLIFILTTTCVFFLYVKWDCTYDTKDKTKLNNDILRAFSFSIWFLSKYSIIKCSNNWRSLVTHVALRSHERRKSQRHSSRCTVRQSSTTRDSAFFLQLLPFREAIEDLPSRSSPFRSLEFRDFEFIPCMWNAVHLSDERKA